jgi:amino acid adenylation domain-containing protein
MFDSMKDLADQGAAGREQWRTALAGAPTLLALPTDRPRPAAPSGAGAAHHFPLRAAGLDALRGLGGPDVTRFEALLAAFTLLLSRQAGQQDLLVGTPAGGSGRPGAGPGADTLVLRVRASRNATLRAHVCAAAAAHRDARARATLPLADVVGALALQEEPGVHPLVQVGLALGAAAGDRAGLDLALAVAPGDGVLAARFDYDPALFDAATIGRLAGQLAALVETGATRPDVPCSALRLLTAGEERQLAEWNAASLPFPADRLLHEMVEAQAALTPDREALSWSGGRLTYAELNRRANQVAHVLRAGGVGAESLVAVCASRSCELVVALLGILKSGAAYVPLDPAYPAERLALMLEDTRAAVLITEEGLLPRLPSGHAARVIHLDRDAALFAAASVTNPAPLAEAEGLAYVIYTSGSTGRPKGVALTHRSAVAFLAWAHTVFSPAELAGTLASTSICFDLSVFEMFAPLSCGGCVILARDALELAGHPLAGRVTLVNTVPSAMTELVRLRALPAGVRTVNLAGEPLPLRLAQDLYALGTVERVYNLYGPSEDTTYSTFTLVPRPTTQAPTIGRPLANTQAHLLDPQLDRVPLGAVGELYLGGDGLARGYLGRPDLTAERFVPDPFGGRPGARLYRTGDLARQRGDGELLFLGRMDHQVKIRGFRVEPGEVEDALVRHGRMAEAVVVARPPRPGAAPQLVAYVVARAEPDAGALRARLRAHLPEHMVPSRVVFLDRLPLTPNGKVDRRALPEPAAEEGAAGPAPARTPTEEALARLWADVLGVPRVGADDDFFTRGGDSLLAVQMVARAREAFGVDLPATAAFEQRALRRLAARIDALRGGGQEGDRPLGRDDQAPPVASFAQERLWLAEQLTAGRPVYTVPWILRVSGALEVAALERALGEIVRRHEVLRTVFEGGAEAGPRPQVLAFEGFTLAVDGVAPRPEAEVARRIEAEVRRPLDLAAGPVCRARLLRLGPLEHVLVFTAHHVAVDGGSLEVLIGELAALYAAFAQGRPSPLGELPLRYADYARWQRAAPAPDLGRWRRRLAGAPAHLDLPSDRVPPPVPTFRGDRREALIEGPLALGLSSLARQAGATPFMGLLAAFAVLLGRLSGQDDVVIGTPVAQRTRRELQPLVGFFVNMLALRVDLSGRPTFREVLGRVREACLDAYADQDVPFERLVEELQPERAPGRTPLFEVVVAQQATPPPRTLLPGVTLTASEVGTRTAKFALTLFLEERPHGVLATVEFAEDRFDGRRIEGLLGQLHTLLAAAVADPDRPVGRLPLLTAEETRVRASFSETALAVGPETVMERVAAQARLHPNALALSGAGRRLTYGQLEAESDQLARRLRALGVAPEDRLALCLAPSPLMVVAALAAMKAGGAYVPLDPAYPAERLDYIAGDARARAVLADAAGAARLSATGLPVLRVDRPGEGPEAWQWQGGGPDPDALAYVVYTSGSTGRPKGVAVTHRGLGNLVAWHHERYALTPADRTSQVAAPGFDAAVWEVWPTLSAGASLHFPPAGARLSPPELLGWLAEEGITVAFLPTPLAEAVLAEDLPPGLALRALLTGGDRLTRRPAPAAPFRLVNHYGPTEVSVVTTAADVAPEGSGAPSIGYPIANLRLSVLDRWMEPVPEGVTGELYVGGPGLARGYLGRPEWTAERFVPDPSGAQPGARLYRTGDLVRYRPDGSLDFAGRADRQVKVRGVRIEPGEIEAALAALPDLEAAVVELRRDRLVAYVVARRGRTCDADGLRRRLRETLPESMVPAAMVVLDALPLSPNGKVDRAALPEPEAERPSPALPQTPMEAVVADVWGQVLGLAAVGRDDDFFALGGHSLLAGQAAARLQDALGLPVTLPLLFECPTVSSLAGALSRLVLEPAAEPGPRPRSRERRPVAALDVEGGRG